MRQRMRRRELRRDRDDDGCQTRADEDVVDRQELNLLPSVCREDHDSLVAFCLGHRFERLLSGALPLRSGPLQARTSLASEWLVFERDALALSRIDGAVSDRDGPVTVAGRGTAIRAIGRNGRGHEPGCIASRRVAPNPLRRGTTRRRRAPAFDLAVGAFALDGFGTRGSKVDAGGGLLRADFTRVVRTVGAVFGQLMRSSRYEGASGRRRRIARASPSADCVGVTTASARLVVAQDCRRRRREVAVCKGDRSRESAAVLDESHRVRCLNLLFARSFEGTVRGRRWQGRVFRAA